MQELSYEEITQQPAYEVMNLVGRCSFPCNVISCIKTSCSRAGDIGGSMGLFMGGSLLTLVGIFDLVIHFMIKKVMR